VCQIARHADEGNEDLDPGESEAIALAEKHRPDVLLLIDEEPGRVEAQRRKISTTGTLGVLDDAAARDLEWLLARDRKRRKGK
jgi:predicted nucleic acid-binding protein